MLRWSHATKKSPIFQRGRKLAKYILQTKHSVDGIWNDAEFKDYHTFRDASEDAGKQEAKFNRENGVKDPQSPEWVQVRAVPRNRDHECAGA